MPSSIEQACAIPYRRSDGQIEFCLITSIKKGRWQFPKGIIDPGETWRETALKEAEEEAGIRGRVVGQPIGKYKYAKWGKKLTVTVTMMEVTAEDDHWHEADLRKRCWVPAEEARELIGKPELLEFLDAAVDYLESNGKHPD